MISGRKARRELVKQNRRRGAGWTRPWRKGRGIDGVVRHPRTGVRP